MSIRFESKAQNLAILQGRLNSAAVPPLYFFSVGSWQADLKGCLTSTKAAIGEGPYIVRSSRRDEDSYLASHAGAFASVRCSSFDNLREAIDQVIESYRRSSADDEVLIMPLLTDVKIAGVAFSHDPNTGSPMRSVNWTDDGSTDAVTSGLGGRLWVQAPEIPDGVVSPVGAVVMLIEELIGLYGGVALEFEFAVTESSGIEQLWILQVRPLVMQIPIEPQDLQRERLERISRKVHQGMHPHPFLLGRRTVYGVMPDWNPAEIIGVRPKPLALSLYREMITDSIWAFQRSNYGYRNLRGFPIMQHFFGAPYIDVRVSFNSFVPADLDDGLGGRLVDYYINRLLEEPSLHDKVEFEVVFSCYTLDLPERLSSLREAGFKSSELEALSDSLRRLTRKIIDPSHGLWKSDAARLQTLDKRREQLFSLSSDPLERIYWLLEDGKRYGTLPFAGLARAGFVAVQLLRSLVAIGVLSSTEGESFMGSVSTVSSQLLRDRAILDRSSFLARYGHLRPGTYDLLSPRYDEAPDLYFDWERRPSPTDAQAPVAFTVQQLRSIADLLDEHGLHPDPVGLLEFIQAGIELRELAKFHFSRNLSDALALIVEWGTQHGLESEDLAFCDVSVFKELHTAAIDEKRLLANSIEQGRLLYEQTSRLLLPPLIAASNDVWAFEWPEVAPNYVTQRRVVAPVASEKDVSRLAGAIVCIQSADPGYDWLFSHPIAGLITAWGGANSHMAIRAHELNLPAVIGAGEILFRRWSQASRLLVDCEGKRVQVIS